MAIDFAKTFGANSNKGAAAASKEERPKSKFWLNIGYDSGVPNKEGEGNQFVSLPIGIPLDSQDKLPTNGRNREFAAFQAARNDLMDQILEVANTLQPGQEQMLNLQIQLRRINEDQAEIPADQNQFVRRVSLVG